MSKPDLTITYAEFDHFVKLSIQAANDLPDRATKAESSLAAANATIAAQRLALATLREACIEEIGNEHDEVQCSICLAYWPTSIPPQHYDDCFLAQPADDAAALAGAVLAAADASNAALGALLRHYERHATHRCEIHTDAKDAEGAYRRARSALRGNGAVEG